MASFTGYIAQCIHIGDPNSTVPTTSVCGPFPTKIPTVAPGVPTPGGGYCPTGNCFETPGDIVSRIMLYVFPFAGIALFVVFVSAGYDMIRSRGDATKLQSAMKKLITSLTGFGILIISYVVVKTVALILGFTSPV